MPDLAAACRHPFSNGTEQHAWISSWCEFCVHDHGMTHEGAGGSYGQGQGCPILLDYMVDPDAWPMETWIPEPDDGKFFLPSRMICLKFEACHQDDCEGDPGASERAERVADVLSYWKGADA